MTYNDVNATDRNDTPMVQWGWRWPHGLTIVVDVTPASVPWPAKPPFVPPDSAAARIDGDPSWVRRTVTYGEWEDQPT